MKLILQMFYAPVSIGEIYDAFICQKFRHIAKIYSIICTMRLSWLWLMENGIIYLSQGFCCLAFSVNYLNMFYFAAFKGRDTLNDQLDITQFEEISEVFMPELPKDVIKSYVDTGESM